MRANPFSPRKVALRLSVLDLLASEYLLAEGLGASDQGEACAEQRGAAVIDEVVAMVREGNSMGAIKARGPRGDGQGRVCSSRGHGAHSSTGRVVRGPRTGRRFVCIMTLSLRPTCAVGGGAVPPAPQGRPRPLQAAEAGVPGVSAGSFRWRHTQR